MTSPSRQNNTDICTKMFSDFLLTTKNQFQPNLTNVHSQHAHPAKRLATRNPPRPISIERNKDDFGTSSTARLFVFSIPRCRILQKHAQNRRSSPKITNRYQTNTIARRTHTLTHHTNRV